MRNFQNTLYCIAAPLALLPVMDMALSQVPDYLRGTEFQTFLSEIIIQLLSGVVDAFIAVVFSGLFGGLAGG